MNEYIVSEKELDEAEGVLSDLFQMLQAGMSTTLDLQHGILISAGLLTWIGTVKQSNLIKGDTNVKETKETKEIG